MKSIIATALVALAMASTLSVGANAASFAEDFFKQLQCERGGGLLPEKIFEDIRLNGH